MYDVSFKQKEKNQVGGILVEGTLTLEARHHQKDICKQLNGVGKLIIMCRLRFDFFGIFKIY